MSQPPLSARDAAALLQHGLELLNRGHAAEAVECARRVRAAGPQVPDACFLEGLALQRLGDDPNASRSFEAMIKLAPKSAAGWAHLAESATRLGQYEQADAALRKAKRHEDGNASTQQVIALTLSALGEHAKSLQWFKRSASAQPGNPGPLLNLANCQLFLGQLTEAEATIRQALKVQPLFPDAHLLLSSLRKAEDRTHIDEMYAYLRNTRYPPAAACFLHYACGKELEDLELWDEAFDAYHAGANARRQTITYDEAAEIESFAAAERLWTPEWLSAGPDGHEDASPIFVLGQPRSGTTLVDRILGAHSDVHSAGELRQFGDAIAELTGYQGNERYAASAIKMATEINPATLGQTYLSAAARFRKGAACFVDKQPGNFLYIPLILKSLPQAKVVLLQRGAMDTCFSAFKQLFKGAYPYSYDLEETGRHFARFHRLVRLWGERFGERLITVQYESITANLEPEARKLIDAVGLDWDNRCLAFHRDRSAVSTASAVQVREQAHTRSINRWRKYEAHLAPLQKTLENEGIDLE